MKIRVQLALMMAAVVAPLALVAGASTYALYESQREVHSQRYLERVRGLRLALDTELLGTVRLLGAFASRQSLATPQPPDAQQMADPLQRILLQNPLWSSIMLIENDGSVVARTDRPGITLGPLLDTDTRLQVVRSGQPAVSNLVALPGGAAYYTYVAVPIVSGTRVLRMAAIGIHQRNWLAFLRSYPIAEGATLTLNDAHGMIIARTLNNDQWVGKKSRQDFLDRAAASNEGAFVNPGLEGQSFYSAYSRLTAAPWMLGTGVPADTVEAALRSQTLLLCGGLLLAALVAAAVATTLGRDITRALHSLADASRRPAGDIGQAIERPLAIVEAESVRRLLRDTLLNETGARAEAEMAREQAERANKGKDEFLAMLAHELRNPLSAMSASVALLGAKNANAQTDRHAIEVLRRQAGQMSMLVNDLLDAARANSGKLMLRRADVDLAQLVASVVRAFQHSGRTEHLRVSTSLEPAVVQADAMRLEQVVANLLDNAAKFTAAGGRVQVTLQVVGATATLTIADDGIGIDPALLPHLFDPFTQAEAGLDRTRGGLGLGLHVVKRLAELHGGSVEAHSDGPARGARFTLRLPALTSTAPAAPADAIGPAEGLAPLRVVLVEDNADVREAAARLLHLAGHDTRSAVDGHSGLQLVLEDQPDVALIDIGLPGLDGLEIARRLRGRGTLLLALTAYGDDSMRTQAQQAGFDGFLQKPFDLRAFEFAVLAARARREQTA